MNKKMKAVVLAALAFLLLLDGEATISATERKSESEAVVIFVSAEGKRLTVQAEVAHTPASREKGLMFRRNLGPDRGMLFIFPHASFQRMWMKDTFIPLDMIFINDMMRVVGIVENTQPHDTTSIEVSAPSRYVVEVNAFFCRRFGVKAGDRVIIEGIEVTP